MRVMTRVWKKSKVQREARKGAGTDGMEEAVRSRSFVCMYTCIDSGTLDTVPRGAHRATDTMPPKPD